MSKTGKRATVAAALALLWLSFHLGTGLGFGSPAGGAQVTIIVTGPWCTLGDGRQIACAELDLAAELGPASRVTVIAEAGSEGVVTDLVARLVAAGHTVIVDGGE